MNFLKNERISHIITRKFFNTGYCLIRNRYRYCLIRNWYGYLFGSLIELVDVKRVIFIISEGSHRRLMPLYKKVGGLAAGPREQFWVSTALESSANRGNGNHMQVKKSVQKVYFRDPFKIRPKIRPKGLF